MIDAAALYADRNGKGARDCGRLSGAKFSCDTVSQEKLARLLFELLDFGIRENEQPRSGNERYMHIQIQNIVHQTAIAFKTVAGVQRRKVRRWVRRTEKEFGAEIETEQNQNGLQIMILFQ